MQTMLTCMQNIHYMHIVLSSTSHAVSSPRYKAAVDMLGLEALAEAVKVLSCLHLGIHNMQFRAA